MKVTTGYRLDPLTPSEIGDWDELITKFDGRDLFHQSPWLDYLVASRGVEIARWAIRHDTATLGYLCGGLLRIGPFKILGSPLRSWGTNFMGPVMNGGVDQVSLLGALDDLAQAERLAMVELEHPSLSPTLLQRAGFEPVGDWTFLVDLTPGDPAPMWRALESTCRNRIRKAQHGGLIVEDTDDAAIVDEYYAFYTDLMRRKRRRPPFSREIPRQLFSSLKKADRLFALRVKDADGRVLSVGLFPHDDRTMYFWSGASREESHPLCPNDLLHWSAMQLGASRGLTSYNMSGHGRFKRKFGGTLTEVSRWHKCYWTSARWARRAYKLWFDTWSVRSVVLPARHEASRSLPKNGSGPIEVVTTSQRPSFRPTDVYRAPLHDFPIRDEILYQYLPLSRGMDVLEIGPGSGFTAFRVRRQVESLTLLDVASGNVAQLRRELGAHRNLDFVCADVCQPGLREQLGKTFDAVYAIEVLEFLPDPEACLKNLAAILRPRGTLLLQFPNYPPGSSPGITCIRTRKELNALMTTAGFSSWSVCSLKLRTYAAFLYETLHEKPLREYRRRQAHTRPHRPLIYDEVWAFQHGQRLEPFKYALHLAWAGLSSAMRLGGPAFAHTRLGEDILNHNLLVLARR